MFVDTELLRCGADFSRSAGSLAQQGAQRFASIQLTPKVFGDFAEADDFHGALKRAHETHVANLQRHNRALEALAEKAQTAATTFLTQDELAADAVNSTLRTS
jgi:hypothetical protein